MCLCCSTLSEYSLQTNFSKLPCYCTAISWQYSVLIVYLFVFNLWFDQLCPFGFSTAHTCLPGSTVFYSQLLAPLQPKWLIFNRLVCWGWISPATLETTLSFSTLYLRVSDLYPCLIFNILYIYIYVNLI